MKNKLTERIEPTPKKTKPTLLALTQGTKRQNFDKTWKLEKETRAKFR